MPSMNLKKNREQLSYTVIVPTFNSENTLDACLRALDNQSIQREIYEIIVVDDGSSDNTLQIAERYPVKILKSNIRTGAYVARNNGIVNASGKVLVFTDATCYPCHDWLSNLLSEFEDTNVGCVAGQILSAPPTTLIQHFCQDRKTHDMGSYFERKIPFFACGNVAIRREVFERIGLFDQSLQSGGDGDFSFRVKQDGRYRIVLQPNACVYYNHRETLRALLEQAYKYGQGIARFRLNYSGCPEINKPIGISNNVVSLIRQVTGLLIIPWKTVKELRRLNNLAKALAYPWIDKLHSLWFHAGIVIGLIKFRGNRKAEIPRFNS